jgi:prepilin-type N-terminal cleavage/methylation domain-containing protein
MAETHTVKIERKGFTLTELLVVIAIIAILAAILFP